jgi:hypothetical protein
MDFEDSDIWDCEIHRAFSFGCFHGFGVLNPQSVSGEFKKIETKQDAITPIDTSSGDEPGR